MNDSTERLPFLPDEEGVQSILAGKAKYPIPFLENGDFPSTLQDEIELRGSSVECKTGVWHAVKRISILAEEAICIHEGAVLVAPEIELKAPLIFIWDSKRSIKTTLIGRIVISASYLEIDRANVLPTGGGRIDAARFKRRGVPALEKALGRTKTQK